jgi:hypothetical protein
MVALMVAHPAAVCCACGASPSTCVSPPPVHHSSRTPIPRSDWCTPAASSLPQSRIEEVAEESDADSELDDFYDAKSISDSPEPWESDPTEAESAHVSAQVEPHSLAEAITFALSTALMHF